MSEADGRWSEESLAWTSPRLRRVLERLGDRSAAAVGARQEGPLDRAMVVEAEEPVAVALRRMLGDLAELEDLQPLLEYLARRVQHVVRMAVASGGLSPETLFSEAGQMVVLGLLFAADREVSAGAGGSAPSVGPPAFESFGAAVRPAHGGHPGSTV